MGVACIILKEHKAIQLSSQIGLELPYQQGRLLPQAANKEHYDVWWSCTDYVWISDEMQRESNLTSKQNP